MLLIRLPIVFNPARHVTALRIMVRPMNDASFVVPLVFTIERDCVALPERGDSGGKIDIVSDEQCLSGLQLDNESLMPAPIVVVR